MSGRPSCAATAAGSPSASNSTRRRAGRARVVAALGDRRFLEQRSDLGAAFGPAQPVAALERGPRVGERAHHVVVGGVQHRRADRHSTVVCASSSASIRPGPLMSRTSVSRAARLRQPGSDASCSSTVDAQRRRRRAHAPRRVRVRTDPVRRRVVSAELRSWRTTSGSLGHGCEIVPEYAVWIVTHSTVGGAGAGGSIHHKHVQPAIVLGTCVHDGRRAAWLTRETAAHGRNPWGDSRASRAGEAPATPFGAGRWVGRVTGDRRPTRAIRAVLDRLTAGQWLELPDTRLIDVAPRTSPGGSTLKVVTWSGGAYDSRRDASAGLGRRTQRLRGQRGVRLRSSHPALAAAHRTERGRPCAHTDVSRRAAPRPSHVQLSRIRAVARARARVLARAGRGPAVAASSAVKCSSSMSTSVAGRAAHVPTCRQSSGTLIGAQARLDPASGRIFFIGSQRAALQAYDPGTNRWSSGWTPVRVRVHATAAIDPVRREFMLIGSGGKAGAQALRWHLDRAGRR